MLKLYTMLLKKSKGSSCCWQDDVFTEVKQALQVMAGHLLEECTREQCWNDSSITIPPVPESLKTIPFQYSVLWNMQSIHKLVSELLANISLWLFLYNWKRKSQTTWFHAWSGKTLPFVFLSQLKICSEEEIKPA